MIKTIKVKTKKKKNNNEKVSYFFSLGLERKQERNHLKDYWKVKRFIH